MKTFGVTAELTEVGNPEITETLNQSPTAKITIPFGPFFGSGTGNEGQSISYVDIEMPRAGLAIEYNRNLVFAGPILAQTFDFKDDSLQLNALGIFEITKRRVFAHHGVFQPNTATAPWVPTAYIGVGWDQAHIVKYFIDIMQTQDHGNLNIVNEFQTTGVNRTYEVKATDLKDIYQIISDRAALINGFDFKFTPRWRNGIRNEEIEWLFEIFYPAEGRETELVFELGSNVDFNDMVVNGTEISFAAFSVMEANGNPALIGYDEDLAAIAADYRLDWVDREHTDVKNIDTADLYALLARIKRAKASKVPSLIAPLSLFEEFIIGDQVRIKANWGLAQLDDMFRIMQFTVRPKEGTVAINVAPLNLTGANDE